MAPTKPYSCIVITGSSGWLGHAVVDAVVNGLADCQDLATPPFGTVPVIGIDQVKQATTKPDEVKFIQADLTDATACNKVFAKVPKGALIIHLVGIIHPRKVAQFTAVNVGAAQNVLTAALSCQARRIIMLSSNSVCGCNANPADRFTEASPYQPYLGYGRSKMQMELLTQALLEKQPTAWTIIRAPWFYGPGQPPRQSLFFSMIRQGRGPIVGGGDNRRSMAYTTNLAQGIVRAALTRKAAGQIYWIADAMPYTMNQIIDTVELLLEEEFGLACARKRLRLPGVAAKVAYGCDYLLQAAGLYHQKIHVLSEMNKTIACSISKAQDELGYHPTVALEQGMRQSIQDLLERGGQI